MRIDGEVSLCDRARFNYAWMDSSAPHMQRDFGVDDIGAILSRNRFAGAVLAGLLPDAPAETDWLLGLMGAHPVLQGVMTAVASPMDWDRWQQNPAFLGVAQAPAAMAPELASRGLRCTMAVSDALAALDRAPNLRVLVRATAGQRFFDRDVFEAWRELLAPLESAGLSVMISGLIEDAGTTRWRADTYRPWVQYLLSRFGAERIVFGSGWPLVMHSGTWKEELACFTQALGAQSMEKRELILGKNAANWFGLSYTE